MVFVNISPVSLQDCLRFSDKSLALVIFNGGLTKCFSRRISGTITLANLFTFRTLLLEIGVFGFGQESFGSNTDTETGFGRTLPNSDTCYCSRLNGRDFNTKMCLT